MFSDISFLIPIYIIYTYTYNYLFYVIISIVYFHISHAIHRLLLTLNYQRDIKANSTVMNLRPWYYSTYEPKGNCHI